MAEAAAAKPAEVKQQAASQLRAMPESYLDCRDLRHPFRRVAHYWLDKRHRVVIRMLTCPRCGLERRDYITASTGEMRMRYRYPKGYQFKGLGDFRPGIRAVRMTALDRAVIEEREEEE